MPNTTRLSAALLSACALASPCIAVGQPEPPRAKAEAKTAKTDPAAPNALTEFLRTHPQAIFLLYNDFDLLEKPFGVFVTTDAYQKLTEARESAIKGKASEFTKFDLKGYLGERWADLDAEVEARVDGPRGADLELQLQEADCSQVELFYRDARRDSTEFVRVEPWLTRLDARSPYMLRVDRPGAYRCKLKLHVEIDRGPNYRNMQLTVPQAAVKSFRLKENSGRPEARIEAAWYSTRTDQPIPLVEAGRTLAPRLRDKGPLDVSWRLTQKTVEDAAPNVKAAAIVRCRVRGGRLRTDAEFSVQSLREMREWTFRLAPGDQITDVQVRQNDQLVNVQQTVDEKASDRTRLRIQPSDPFLGAATIRLGVQRPLPPLSPQGRAEVEIAPPVLEGAVASGPPRVFLYSSAAEDVRLYPPEKLAMGVLRLPIQGAEPEAQAEQPMEVFQIDAPAVALKLNLEGVRPVLVGAASAVKITVGAERSEIQADFRLTLRQGHLETLEFHAPLLLEEVKASSAVVRTIQAAPAVKGSLSRSWLLTLRERAVGVVNVTVHGSLPTNLEKPNGLFIPYLKEAMEFPETVLVYKAGNIQLRLDVDRIRNLESHPIGILEAASKPWLSFRSLGRPAVLEFTPHRLRRQTSVAVKHRIRPSGESLRVTTNVRWEGRYEPIREVQLRAPEGIKDAVVTGERLAVPSGGLVVGAGLHEIQLAAPSDHCEAKIEYKIPAPKGASETPLLVGLFVPEADHCTHCWAELRGQPGARPLPPPGWEQASADAASSWEWAAAEPAESENPEQSGDPTPGLVVQTAEPTPALEWRTEPTALLAPLIAPRVLIQESFTASGRRRGRFLALIGRHRTNVIDLAIPPRCTLIEVFVDGKSVAPSPETGNERASVRLPAEDRPCSLEVRYEARGAPLSGIGRMNFASPHFVDAAAVDQVVWQIQSGGDLLLAGSGAEGPGDVRWSFAPGYLRSPTSSSPAGVAGDLVRDWLQQGEPGSVWIDDAWFREEGKRWIFTRWGDLEPPSVYVARESFWVLLCSGVALLLGVLLSNLKPKRRTSALIGCLVAGAAIAVVLPEWAPWLWLGAQWGVYLGLAVVFAPFAPRSITRWRALRSRRRLLLTVDAKRGSSLLNSPVARPGSSLARTQPPSEKPPSAAVNPLGSTLDR